MQTSRYIAVEGPIGVGKTTLAEMLARDLNGRLVREPSEENPFLKKFYEDREKHAFSTQLFCLLSRHQQQKKLFQLDLFEQSVIADYCFDKDRIFAYLNLSDNELALYEKIYSLVASEVRAPDLTVYLQASTNVLINRLRRRGNPWEQKIPSAYLEELVQAYNKHFFHYEASPILVVNTAEIDFVDQPSHYQTIFKEIQNMQSGMRHLILKP